MRHFRFFADSEYLLSIIDTLNEGGCIAYSYFVPDKVLGKVNKKIGDYDIYIDDRKVLGSHPNIGVILGMLSPYEYMDIRKGEYDGLVDKNCERSYDELVGKYKVITEERDKYVELRLKAQREDILRDVLEEYKDDIERRVGKEVRSRYDRLLERFHNEGCDISEVCSLYKKYIDAEIKKGVEEHVEKVLSEDNLMRIFPYMSKEMCHKIMASGKRLLDEFYYSPIYPIFDNKSGTIKYTGAYEHDLVYRDIKKFKNDLVDNFMAVSGHKRGDRDYMLYMRRAGRLADLIEGKLWEYYVLSIKDKEAKDINDKCDDMD